MCPCAGRALSTGARIGDGAAIPGAADVGRAPSPKVTPPPRGRRDRPARRPLGEKRRAGLTAQARRPPHGHATRSPRRGRRGDPLREFELFEVRVAVSVVDPPHGISSSPRVRLMRQTCCGGRERLMVMRCGDSPGKCREFGAGAGDPRIVTSGARAPCAGLALDDGRIGRPGRSVARMLRSRHATIPEGVGLAGYERQKIRRRRSRVPAT